MDKKSNKVNLLPRDGNGFVNLDLIEDNSDYSNLPEAKILDPELYSLVSKSKLIEPSDVVEQQVMQFYRKEYRYKIIWWKIKLKIQEWKTFLQSISQIKMKVALASLVVLFLLGVSVHYLYQSANYTNQELSSNKQTPQLNITPVASPTQEVTTTITPNIKENNPNNDKRNQGNSQNGQEQGNEIKQPYKPAPIKGLEQEENNMAFNSTKPRSGNLRTFEATGINTSTKKVSLDSIEKIYLGDL